MVIALNQKKSNPKTGGEQSVKFVDRNHENGAEKSKKPQKNYLVRIFWISGRRWMDFHHSPHFHQGYIIGIYYIKDSTLTPMIRRKGCTLEQTSSGEAEYIEMWKMNVVWMKQ